MKKFNPGIKCIVLDEPTKAFLSSLLFRRKAAGMTQRNLADMLNIADTNIAHYENGVRLPSVKTLVKLAEIFAFDLSDSINYQLYYERIRPERIREMFIRFGFSFTEMARLTGYSPKSIKDCYDFNYHATTQCMAAVLGVLEQEQASSEFRRTLMKKGR